MIPRSACLALQPTTCRSSSAADFAPLNSLKGLTSLQIFGIVLEREELTALTALSGLQALQFHPTRETEMHSVACMFPQLKDLCVSSSRQVLLSLIASAHAYGQSFRRASLSHNFCWLLDLMTGFVRTQVFKLLLRAALMSLPSFAQR